jgi:hypothetical protein
VAESQADARAALRRVLCANEHLSVCTLCIQRALIARLMKASCAAAGCAACASSRPYYPYHNPAYAGFKSPVSFFVLRIIVHRASSERSAMYEQRPVSIVLFECSGM